MDELRECPLCCGDAAALGSLGRLMHYRCQNCGGQFSEPIPQDAEVTD